MKKIVFILAILILNACISASVAINTNGSSGKTITSQSTSDILTGKQERKALEQEPFGTWFNTNYENYEVDIKTVEKISPYLKGIHIKAFMGTWCSDSKRETPSFYKILDTAKFDYENLELITVTREKNTPEGYEKGLNIEMVPTFIFYKEGKEIGRYVEFPRETLEKDILAIVSGAPYKHSYED